MDEQAEKETATHRQNQQKSGCEGRQRDTVELREEEMSQTEDI